MRFIALYSLSALVLMAIIAVLYYNKSVNEAKSSCKSDLKNAVMSAEMDLRKACMNNRIYRFDPDRYKLHVALFDRNRRPVASSLTYSDVDLDQAMRIMPDHIHIVKKLPEPIQDIQYIVAEDLRMPQQLHRLKLLIAVTMIVSMLFVALIGYMLSRLLLKPVRERIRELNRFIKDTTHEINTPVTALLMSVSALKRKGIREEKLLRHISISSKQIANIYNTLSYVSFSELKHEKSRRFDLKKEIRKSILFFEEIAAAKQIEIRSDLESTYLKMEKESADKLINNLLSNAIKYSFSHTTITVTLRDGRLSVADEGIGISEQDQMLILQRYKRASELGGGFGIGLDIVNTICKKYGITLEIVSAPNRGSTFILDFRNLIRTSE